MNNLELSLQILKLVFTEENLDNLSPSERAEEVLNCFELIYNAVVDLENPKSLENASFSETIEMKEVFSSGEIPLEGSLESSGVSDSGINRSNLSKRSSLRNKKTLEKLTLEEFLSDLDPGSLFELPESKINGIKSWRLSILEESKVEEEVFLVDSTNIREILSTLAHKNRVTGLFKIKNIDRVVSVRPCGKLGVDCNGRYRGACSKTPKQC